MTRPRHDYTATREAVQQVGEHCADAAWSAGRHINFYSLLRPDYARRQLDGVKTHLDAAQAALDAAYEALPKALELVEEG